MLSILENSLCGLPGAFHLRLGLSKANPAVNGMGFIITIVLLEQLGATFTSWGLHQALLIEGYVPLT